MSIIHKIRNSSANSCTNIDPKLQKLLDALQSTSVPQDQSFTIHTTSDGTQQQLGPQLSGVSTFPPSFKDFVDAMQATVQPLSNEEQKEYQRLEKEHEEEVKSAKLAYFKALPPEFRQTIINILQWETVAKEINHIEPPKSERLRELEGRARRTNPFAGYGHSYSKQFYPSGGSPLQDALDNLGRHHYPTNMPNGLTLEQLEEAHLEATIEEELLKNE